MYSELAGYAANPKEMLGMFSEMLREMDKNTIKYMVDDMQEQIEKQKAEIEGHKRRLRSREKSIWRHWWRRMQKSRGIKR